MISQQITTDDIMTWLLLIIAIILVALILYLGTRLIAGKKETDTGYIIRLLLVALLIVLLVAVVIGAIIRGLGELDITTIFSSAAAQLIPVLVYLAIVLLIKYLLIPELDEMKKWNASILIGLITLFLIYVINILMELIFRQTIIQGV